MAEAQVSRSEPKASEGQKMGSRSEPKASEGQKMGSCSEPKASEDHRSRQAERSASPREASDLHQGLDIALGQHMSFEGLLVLPKPARIDGRVAGAVMAGASVWVGATGVVDADLEADTIVVEGTVRGDLRARTSIELGPEAVVSGDLTGPRIVVADGACVNGRCRVG